MEYEVDLTASLTMTVDQDYGPDVWVVDVFVGVRPVGGGEFETLMAHARISPGETWDGTLSDFKPTSRFGWGNYLGYSLIGLLLLFVIFLISYLLFA
jgi:hypothetical protein